MNTRLFWYVLLPGLILLSATAPTVFAAHNNDQALLASKQLGRGINLAGALDAPREGEWGVTLEASYFAAIRSAGFDSVIIPIRWSAHTDKTAPYQIDPAFLARVDWAVAQGLQNHLTVLLRTHQYEGFGSEPEKELPRYYAIWEQFSAHFKDRPDSVIFEISNEPGYTFSPSRWNRVTADVLKIIRHSNPTRTIMVCPVFGEKMGVLSSLELPEEERNILVRLYYFDPTEFTMQGASWINGSKSWLGRKWTGTEPEKEAIRGDFARAQDWARQHGRRLFLGEFGTLNTVDMDSRVRWTRFIIEQAGKCGMAWGYWDFCSVFGAYDSEKREWEKPLLDALSGK